MSQRKRGQARPFLGHKMTKYDHQALVSLTQMTTQYIGLPKRKITSEDQIFDFLKEVFDFDRDPEATFQHEIRRARLIVGAMKRERRRDLISKAGYCAPRSDFQKRVRNVTNQKTKKSKAKGYSRGSRDDFYASWGWRTLRMEVLKEHGRRCMCCGATPDMADTAGYPVRICVDHIQPLAKRWDLRLDRSNLQVLCDECNQGKGAWDQSDYRPDEFPDDEPMSLVEAQLGERLHVINGGKAA